MDPNNPLLFRNLKALNILGMWPPKNRNLHCLYSLYSKFIFFWFASFTTSQFIEMKYIYHDFEELTTNAGVSLLYAVGVAKSYIVLLKKSKVMALVNKIRDTELEILKSNDSKLKRILAEYIVQNWDVSRRFWLLTFWTVLGFIFRPRLEALFTEPEDILSFNGTETGRKKKLLIFSSWFPFDKYSDKNYLLAYGLQTISLIFGASNLGIWDTFIVALMVFAIGQFRVLQHYLKNIYPYEYNDVSEKEINDNFVNCVKHHDMIIQYVKDLDRLISPVMFLDFVVCSLMLCAIGLQATLEGPSVKLFFTIEYLLAMLIQLFMLYWHANEIMIESVKVSEAAWQSRWYDCSNSIKKGLVLVMIKARRPCILTAGRFYSMTLETFILILRASYSYLALLRQVSGRDEDE